MRSVVVVFPASICAAKPMFLVLRSISSDGTTLTHVHATRYLLGPRPFVALMADSHLSPGLRRPNRCLRPLPPLPFYQR